MVVDRNSLGELRDENRWLDALNRYRVNPTVGMNRDTEYFRDKAELEYIQRLDTQPWKMSLPCYIAADKGLDYPGASSLLALIFQGMVRNR
jgi:hypothetical protein